jgi:hypothetical protein
MKSSKSLILFVIAVLSAACDVARAVDAPISKEQVAALFGYPAASALEVIDSTERRNVSATRKSRPLVDSAYLITAKDASFAPLSILVAEIGTLLTHELHEYVEKGLASNIGSDIGFSRIVIPGIGTGHVGPGAIGPGGYSLQAVIAIPSIKKDVLVSLSVVGAGQLSEIPGAERYYALLREGSDLSARLVQGVELAARSVVAAQAALPGNEKAPVALVTSTEKKIPAESAPVAATSASKIWLIVAGALIIAALLFGFSRRGRS